MKTLSLILLFLSFTIHLSAQELTADQLKLRSEIETFLKSEGFLPTIDEDGDISFKREGKLHFISIDEDGPYYITFYRGGFTLTGEDAFSFSPSMFAANELTKNKKAVKVYCTETSVRVATEYFVNNIVDFSATFYRYLNCLSAAHTDFSPLYYKYEEELK